AFALVKTQVEHPAMGSVCAGWLKIWQKGLVPSALTHTGITHSSLLPVGAPSDQKRCWDTAISVLGCGLTARRERLDLRAGALPAGGAVQLVFTDTSGCPA